MHYTTIVLELVQENQALHQELRRSGTLLLTVEQYTRTLKARHQYWMDQLDQIRPASDQSQISSTALGMALDDLQETLSVGSPPVEDAWEPSLDEAMDYIRRRTPPA